jgi:excisionase family DNA binding protein
MRSGDMPHTHSKTAAKTVRSRPSARAGEIEPLAVSPRQACRLLGCGLTRLYELIGLGEVESYLDGRMRRITTRSILARIERLIASSAGGAS